MSLIDGKANAQETNLVEEFAQDKLGVAWDWTSDSAMSEARSVLRNIAALSQHLAELQPA